MGNSKSRLNEDKGLQLCRSNKDLIKQALNQRFALAAAHVEYIEQLKSVGAALRSFVEADDQAESSKSPTVVSHFFTEKSISQSPTVDTTANILSSPESTFSFEFKSHPHHVRFRSETSLSIDENTPAGAAASFSPASRSLEESAFEFIPRELEPWDYFGLDNHSSSEKDTLAQVLQNDGVDEFPNVEEKLPSEEIEESQLSEDEFDEPASSSLVQSFSNINRTGERGLDDNPIASEIRASEIGETENEAKEKLVNGDSSLETKYANGNKMDSPNLSPLRAAPSTYMHSNDVMIRPMENGGVEDRVAPKDFVSSIRAIEQIFIRASESGKEIPRMLEANYFHSAPVSSGHESGSVARLLLLCLACGKDQNEVVQDRIQISVKYLTSLRTSSISTTSPLLVGANSIDTYETCMNSGSHASTLDRLCAWDKKLYDEVKAAQVLRGIFDQKCRILRRQEARSAKTDTTRAVVKDLHSRIGVAIHRIRSITQKIEEIRDTELQPQLEELVEGLRKMWETMLDCHKLQFHIVSISRPPTTIDTDHARQTALHLEKELVSFLSAFTKWISAQKQYVETIDKWLQASVVQQNPSRKRRTHQPRPLSRLGGPPIYMISESWLKMIGEGFSDALLDSIKELISEVSQFVPRQEKRNGHRARSPPPPPLSDAGDAEERLPGLDRFQVCLAAVLARLSAYAEACVEKYTELQRDVHNAKDRYGRQDIGMRTMIGFS